MRIEYVRYDDGESYHSVINLEKSRTLEQVFQELERRIRRIFQFSKEGTKVRVFLSEGDTERERLALRAFSLFYTICKTLSLDGIVIVMSEERGTFRICKEIKPVVFGNILILRMAFLLLVAKAT